MIAVIPARGGSKGLPRKNVLPLAGKPLIAYTIEAAQQAACIDEVIVTTDDLEIAEISQLYGATAPFIRPEHLATDTASAIDVYLHAIEWLSENRNANISKFMVLLPTTPLRTSNDIDNAYNLFMQEEATTLVAVKEAKVPPSWYMEVGENHLLKPCKFGEGLMNNRQDNRKYYIICGAIYILDYDLLKNHRTYYSDKTIAYIMQSNHAVDIDYQGDFDYVEYLLSKECRC